jgi:aminopeptidase N
MSSYRLLLSTLFLAFLGITSANANDRSDTMDVLHYEIHCNLSNPSSHQIQEQTRIHWVNKVNGLQNCSFDLRGLQIDSVIYLNQKINFLQVDHYVKINWSKAISIGDTAVMTFFCQGTPYSDPSWGGFTFNGAYSFNLGVGFSSNPHNLGMAWFPCNDRFDDRSSYTCYIETAYSQMAYCNGLLMDTVHTNNNTVIWHWDFKQAVAPYLASVAVAPYFNLHYQITTHSGRRIPLEIGTLASDSNACKYYFSKVPQALYLFDSLWGNYPFDRAGYVLVPFNGGAMEHASNIAIGRAFVNSGLTYETMHAHELSHMWFGDMVTCPNENEMWLNEGWASYCERIFTEHIYGRASYDASIKSNHLAVLQSAPINDQGYFPVANVPHAITYGSTVYDKGADMIHTLRTYMGDADFYASMKKYLAHQSWSNSSTNGLRDSLIAYTGKVYLKDFFDHWLSQAGFPDIHLIKWSNNHVQLQVTPAQHASQDYGYVPITLSCFDSTFHRQVIHSAVNSSCQSITLNIPSGTRLVVHDFDELLSDALTCDWKVINKTGGFSWANAKLNVSVKNISDSVFLRIEHHWNRPNGIQNPTLKNLVHVADRYWVVQGIAMDKLDATATINYNGSAGNNYLDHAFITNSEDSLCILFRTDGSKDWSILDASEYSINKQGSTSNQIGQITIQHLKQGEYTMGIYDYAYQDTSNITTPAPCITLNQNEINDLKNNCLTISPNPNNGSYTLGWPITSPCRQISIYDCTGRELRKILSPIGNSYLVNTLPKGVNFIKLDLENGTALTGQAIVQY